MKWQSTRVALLLARMHSATIKLLGAATGTHEQGSNENSLHTSRFALAFLSRSSAARRASSALSWGFFSSCDRPQEAQLPYLRDNGVLASCGYTLCRKCDDLRAGDDVTSSIVLHAAVAVYARGYCAVASPVLRVSSACQILAASRWQCTRVCNASLVYCSR